MWAGNKMETGRHKDYEVSIGKIYALRCANKRLSSEQGMYYRSGNLQKKRF